MALQLQCERNSDGRLVNGDVGLDLDQHCVHAMILLLGAYIAGWSEHIPTKISYVVSQGDPHRLPSSPGSSGTPMQRVLSLPNLLSHTICCDRSPLRAPGLVSYVGRQMGFLKDFLDGPPEDFSPERAVWMKGRWSWNGRKTRIWSCVAIIFFAKLSALSIVILVGF